MKRLVLTIAILIGLAAPAWAGFAEGAAAFKRGDYETALREFRPLAEQGDARAQTSLALMYFQGKGVPEDYAEAVKWWRKAAEQGYAKAQTALGYRYKYGVGVPKSSAQAVKWYREAAEQGNAMGQFALGFMYFYGDGVPEDYVLAHVWFNLSAARGYKEASALRKFAKKFMTRAQIAEAQRLAREWKPKKEGK